MGAWADVTLRLSKDQPFNSGPKFSGAFGVIWTIESQLD
jgi:hypothetical protein